MKKNITKEQIVETALELMKNKSDLHTLNLREIARTLGCTHVNLYNYFSSYSDLLWETHAVLHEVFMEMLIARLNTADTAEMRLMCFFDAFVDIYMENKGWFWLAWHEPIEGDRSQRDVDVVEAAGKSLNKYISEIWTEISGICPDADHLKRVLHNTHCYIVGEISNYLLGRGLIESETELKDYIAGEATRMFKLLIQQQHI